MAPWIGELYSMLGFASRFIDEIRILENSLYGVIESTYNSSI